MARQRSAPAALSIQSLDRLLTPPATPSSPQKSEFWGSPPQKSPTHRNPRKKRGPGAAAAPKGLSRGMKHVASEPQLFAMDGSGEFGGVARSVVQPLKLTAHTVPALQTLPDTTPPLVITSSASSPRQQPGSAPAGVSSSEFLAHQQPQRPKSISLSTSIQDEGPLDPGIAAAIAKAVHQDDASALDGLVLPSMKSSTHLSMLSLSTIAESGSEPGNSTADLAALDQVAEKLSELTAAQLNSPSGKTGRSSFEFPVKQDQYAGSPAQVACFPESLKSAQGQPGSQPALESAAFGSDIQILDDGHILPTAQSVDNAIADHLHESTSAAVEPCDSPNSAAEISATQARDSSGSDRAVTASDSESSSQRQAFRIQDSAFFAPAAVKPRLSPLRPSDSVELNPPGRKLKQIPSDSEILIHVSPGDGHQTPFTSGPYSCGPDLCPSLPSSPPAAMSARAAAVALADGHSQGHSEGLPPRPFSPERAQPPSAEPSDMEQRNSSSSILSPTSKLAADIGLFSPRRPPKLVNTKINGLGDSGRLSGDKARLSGERSRGASADRGPPIVRKPLFRVRPACCTHL